MYNILDVNIGGGGKSCLNDRSVSCQAPAYYLYSNPGMNALRMVQLHQYMRSEPVNWVMQLQCIAPVLKSHTCKVAIGNKVDADPVVMESQAKVAHVGPIVAVDISGEQLHVQLHEYMLHNQASSRM